MNRSNLADARDWKPRPKAGADPLYRRLADALADDIAQGRLDAGSRLPTQRALAAALKVSVATVNNAYLEAEQRGLIRRHVGRGTFVASRGQREHGSAGHINLALNLPPFHQAAPMIRSLLAQLIEDADAGELLGYPVFSETSRYAAAVADWTRRATTFGNLRPNELLPCQGATQGLLTVVGHLLQPGDSVVCEQITYRGFKEVARQLQLKVVAAPIDAEGMIPEALDEVAERHQAKAVLLCPTLHNPTGAIASMQRREAWVSVARKRKLWMVEDDVYGALAHHRGLPAALAALAPDLTFHVSSASKAIAPGLRAGWIVPPKAHFDALACALHARTAQVSPFGCPVLTSGAAPFGFLAFAKLCETRMADEIAQRIQRDAEVRMGVAEAALGAAMQSPASARSLHVWLPMPAARAEAMHQLLAQQQIHVTPPSSPMVDAPPAGLRICLGGPERIDDLEDALNVVAGEMARATTAPQMWRP